MNCTPDNSITYEDRLHHRQLDAETPTRSGFLGRDEHLNELLRRYAEEALARKPRVRLTVRSKVEGPSAETAPTRQSHGIGSCAAARKELANFVAQA